MADRIIDWDGNPRRSSGFFVCIGLIAGLLAVFAFETIVATPPLVALKAAFILLAAPVATTVLARRFLSRRGRSSAGPEPRREPADLRQARLAGLLFLYWAAGYFSINQLTIGRETHSLMLEVDRLIPFVPEFALIYVAVYVVFALPFLLVRHWPFFRTAVWAYATVVTASFLIFLTYPVMMPRPELQVTDFSTWVLSLVYRFDHPYNCFPSTHVAMALIAALTVLEASRPLGIFTLIITLAISASTLFVKQHYVMDVLVGWTIALLAYFVYFRQRLLIAMQRGLTGRLGSAIDARIDERVRSAIDRELPKAVRRAVAEELEQRDVRAGKGPEAG